MSLLQFSQLLSLNLIDAVTHTPLQTTQNLPVSTHTAEAYSSPGVSVLHWRAGRLYQQTSASWFWVYMLPPAEYLHLFLASHLHSLSQHLAPCLYCKYYMSAKFRKVTREWMISFVSTLSSKISFSVITSHQKVRQKVCNLSLFNLQCDHKGRSKRRGWCNMKKTPVVSEQTVSLNNLIPICKQNMNDCSQRNYTCKYEKSIVMFLCFGKHEWIREWGLQSRLKTKALTEVRMRCFSTFLSFLFCCTELDC